MAEVRALPAVVGVHLAPGVEPPAVTLCLESTDIRTTTPALLAWLRRHHWRLLSMAATPVTLTDVFAALASVAAAGADGREAR